MPVGIRDGYNFDKGDTAVLLTGERVTIRDLNYRGSEGTVASCKITADDGRIFDYSALDRYEKKVV